MSNLIFAWKTTFKEIDSSKENTIFCVLEKASTTSKLVYYIKQKIDKSWILKSLISDNTYDKETITKNNIRINMVTEQNKLNYIKHHLNLDEEISPKDIDKLFIKTYCENE